MSVRLEEDQIEEIRDLLSRGFKAAWIRDLKVGDIFAGPRIFSHDPPRPLYVVTRILENDDLYSHRVVSMIVYDELDMERHLTYGDAHEIYIWKG